MGVTARVTAGWSWCAERGRSGRTVCSGGARSCFSNVRGARRADVVWVSPAGW